MRKITETRTGKIASDTDLKLEYLYVGDYGKENNIKADFLGYTKKIEHVKHTQVDLTDKLVVTVSSQKGCPMACNFCDCPKYGFHGNTSLSELIHQVTGGVALSGIQKGERLNVHYARMGEPTFNEDVIKSANMLALIYKGTFKEFHPVVSTMCPRSNKHLLDFLHSWVISGYAYGGEDGYGLQFSINTLDNEQRNKMFNNKSLSLEEISELIKKLPNPKKRKFTLNFAVTGENDLDVDKMNKLFDKERCIVKITPIHETVEAVKNGYEIVHTFDVYEKYEKPLVEAGWDVIVFVPSQEEDEDRITCGNSLIALEHKKKEVNEGDL